jgi:hypothetical protein
VAETKIKVTADTSQAERAISGLERSLEGLQSAAGAAGAALAVITGAAAAMTAVILKTANAAGDIIDAADAIGVSADKLQELQYAAGLAGVGADTLNATLTRLNNNIAQGLTKSTGTAALALKNLGIPINELANLKPDEQFQKISERLLAIENPAQRTALAMELFGKQGPAILKVAEELQKVKDITESVGLGVTKRDLVALDEASDSVDQLRILWDAGVKKAVAEIAPYVVAIVNKIKEAIKEAGGFEGIWKRVKEVIRTIANIAAIIGTIIAARLVVGTAQFVIQLGRAVVAAKSLNAILARTPVGLVSAGAAYILDKIGVDLVGSTSELLDLNLDIAGAQDQINKALDDRNKKEKEGKEIKELITEEQEKYLNALDTATAKEQANNQFLRDKINLGERQAQVNKFIREEQDKAVAAGIMSRDQETGQITVINKKAYELFKTKLDTAIQEKLISQDLTEQVKLYDDALARVRSLASEFKGPLTKAVEDYAKTLKILELTEDTPSMFNAKEVQEANDGYAEAQLKLYQQLDNLKSEFEGRSQANAIKLFKQELDIKKAFELEGQELTRRGYKEEELLIAVRAEKKRQDQLLDLQAKAAVHNRTLELYAAEQKVLEASLMTKETMEFDHQEKLFAIRQAAAQKTMEMNLRMGQAEYQYRQFNAQEAKQIATERSAFEQKTEAQKAQFVIQQGADMFSALGQHNKKAFEAAKAFNIANAIMNTYMGATKALATYPPPFNCIAAAAVIGMGLAQVATIRNQQYSGRQLGGPVMGGTSYLVGENGPELFTPNTTGSITRNGDLGGGGPVNVNFTIVANDTTGFDELLTSRQTVIKQIISDAMLERGQRSMV